MWLNSFKIAIVEKDTDKLNKLMDEVPQLETLQEIEEAVHLVEEAKVLVQGLKEETVVSMKKIQKSKEFLRSASAPNISKLDIKS